MSNPISTSAQSKKTIAPSNAISRRDLLAIATGTVMAATVGGGANGALAGEQAANSSPLRPIALRCEAMVNPLGIDEVNPRLTWQLTELSGDLRGLSQTAWQVQVASSPQHLAAGLADVWDSGRVAGQPSAAVVVPTMALAARERYFWRVRVWDQADRLSPWGTESPAGGEPAFWTMGLLNPTDWHAQWLTDATLATPANYPRVPQHCYRAEMTEHADAAKWIVIDLGKAQLIDTIVLQPARPPGLSPDYASFLYPLRLKIQTANRKDFSDAALAIDHTQNDLPNPRPPVINPPRLSFSPVRARFVKIIVTKLPYWEGRWYTFALGRIEIFHGAKELAANCNVFCSDSVETGAISQKYLTHNGPAIFWCPPPPALVAEPPPLPNGNGYFEYAPEAFQEQRIRDIPAEQTLCRVALLRREFTAGANLQRATLYVTARGFYEVNINGKAASNALLAPGFTEFNKRVCYDTFDVTSLIQAGENAIACRLGYGWYAGHMNLSDMCYIFGYVPKALLQLELQYANGRTQVIAGDESWRSTLEGPIRYSDPLAGEFQDLRLEQPGWDMPGFGAASWSPAFTIPRDNTPLTWHRTQHVTRNRTLRPVSHREVSPGVFVFDFGQEFSGWCRLTTDGPAGTHITLRHAECLNDNGNISVRNLWGTLQREDYILDGKGPHTLEPHFTWHGFRYVEVRGLTHAPTAQTLIGQSVRAEIASTSEFECSNPLYNKLMQATRWTQWNMLFDVPTGCAARAERLAWLGDIRDCVNTAMLNMDTAAFFGKYTVDIRDSQTPQGRFCDITPHAQLRGSEFVAGSPGWADCGMSLPWDLYLHTGDKRIIERHFAAARRWVDWVASNNPNHLWAYQRGNDWGDWLSAGNPVTPKEIAATAYFAHSADIMSRMAGVLGEQSWQQHYAALFTDIRRAFAQAYVSADGTIQGDAQGSYALALQFGLLDQPLASKSFQKLLAAVQRAGGHLTTGFLSTRALMQALSRFGGHNIAARMANQTTLPSWGYMVDTIGTTFWESFNTYEKGKPVVLSLNHWPWSSIGEWLWSFVAGITMDDKQPGGGAVIIRPRPVAQVNWCRGSITTARGPVQVQWRRLGATLKLDVVIPPNSEATIQLPIPPNWVVLEGGTPVARHPDVTLLNLNKQEHSLSVASGRYAFECRP